MSLKQRHAWELMTSSVVTIRATESLRAAAALMSQHHIHCLLVPAQEEGRCLGIITVKDIVQVLCEGEPPLLDQLTVEDVMTSPALSVQRDFQIADCLRLMRMSGVRSAPVLEGTRLVGLLSFSDILRALAQTTDDARH